jgi:hypothetical protein
MTMRMSSQKIKKDEEVRLSLQQLSEVALAPLPLLTPMPKVIQALLQEKNNSAILFKTLDNVSDGVSR